MKILPSRGSHTFVARTALAASIAAIAASSAHAAGDPIMPLEQVRPGMQGTAYTVVSGTEITSFPVTVLDVVRAGQGPGSAFIIVRASGDLMDRTGGIAHGMSGSPVYVTGADGVNRLIGGLSYGQGDEANVVGAITPIEHMLGHGGIRQLSLPRGGARRPVHIARNARQADRLRRDNPGDRVLVPLMRWTASGVHPRLVATLRSRLGARVMIDAAGPSTIAPPVAFRPGSSLAAHVLAGPVSVGAIGTTTYVDGPLIAGFGHPFLGAGDTQLLMSDAHVSTVVAAPIRGESYKLASPGQIHGMIFSDRRDGVLGRIGQVTATPIRSRAIDRGRRTQIDLNAKIARQPQLMGLVADVMQGEAALRARDGVGKGTLTVSYTIRAPGLPVTRYRNVYAAEGDAVLLAYGSLGTLLGTMINNRLRQYIPSDIQVTQVFDPQVRAATIVGARIVGKVRPNQPARLHVRLRMWRGPVRTVVVPFRVPRQATSGTVLQIVPNTTTGFDPSPADMTGVLEGSSVPARVARRRAARPATSVHVVRALRMHARARNDAVRVLAPGEEQNRAAHGQVGATPGVVVYGGRASVRLPIG